MADLTGRMLAQIVIEKYAENKKIKKVLGGTKMKALIEAQLKTGEALEIGRYYVIQMQGGSQPPHWWIFDKDYELVLMGSDSTRVDWFIKHGEAFPSWFTSQQEAIHEAVIRIKTEAKVAARIQLGYEPVQRFDKEEKIKK